MDNAEKLGTLVNVRELGEVVSRAIGSMRSYILSLTRLEEGERDEILAKLGAIYDTAFDIPQSDEADVQSAASDDGEPVG
jgi:hypothetical protein